MSIRPGPPRTHMSIAFALNAGSFLPRQTIELASRVASRCDTPAVERPRICTFDLTTVVMLAERIFERLAFPPSKDSMEIYQGKTFTPSPSHLPLPSNDPIPIPHSLVWEITTNLILRHKLKSNPTTVPASFSANHLHTTVVPICQLDLPPQQQLQYLRKPNLALSILMPERINWQDQVDWANKIGV